MDKLEIIGLAVVGTMIGNRICAAGDYIYKKRKRAKFIEQERKRGYMSSAYVESDRKTFAELINKYGDLL